MALIAYGDSGDSLTLTGTYSYFPVDYYKTGMDREPVYTSTTTYNGYYKFDSDGPGIAVVDYGDGTVRQYSFSLLSNGTYRLVLGSKNFDTYNGNNSGYWGTLASGGYLVPERPYIYVDGEEAERVINISFTNNVTVVEIYHAACHHFPILNIPGLKTYTQYCTSAKDCVIDEEKIVRSDNLTAFRVATLLDYDTLGAMKIEFPVGLFKATQLESLRLNGVLDMSDPDSNGIRGVTALQKLSTLEVGVANGKPVYLAEYNSLPELDTLDISTNTNKDIEMEVDTINSSLRYFYFLKYTTGGLTSWREGVSGHGLQNIRQFSSGWGGTLPVDHLPDYIYEMRALTTFRLVYNFFSSVARADTFVGTFYDMVTGWGNITMSSTASDGERNQFYALRLDFYESTGPSLSNRPSGALEAPDGFEMGVSNGTPETPMQMVYVLSNNYGQTWVLKPEESSAAALGATPQKGKLVFTPNGPEYAMGDVITPWETMEVSGRAEAEEECRRRGLPVDNIERYFKDLEHIGEEEP